MTIKILDKSNLKKGTPVTLFADYGRSTSTKIIDEIDRFEVSFTDGEKISTWAKESVIIVASDNKIVTEAKRDHKLNCTIQYLDYFGGLDKVPEEARVKLEEIYELIDKRDMERTLGLLCAGGAHSKEGESIFKHLNSQEAV
tara:strand:- start:388 stop:813 length:426 start_codon:yes stop_codon:yes gene_type:complete